jgi:excisionase family DNA binding protein
VVPLEVTRRDVAEKKLSDLVDRAERGLVGWLDPAERKLPLMEHLDQWEAQLKTTPRGKRRRPPRAKQVALKVGRARRVLDGCGFRVAADIALAPVQEFLQTLTVGAATSALPAGRAEFTLAEAARVLGIKKASVAPLVTRHGLAAAGQGKARRLPRATVEVLLEMRSRGVGHGTAGYYAREVKAFTRWLVRKGKLGRDPLEELPGANPDLSDHRHDRRTPSAEELQAVIAAAHASPNTYRGLSGIDRAILYTTATASGFRVEELASLTPESFDLDGEAAVVTLRAEVAKNGQTAEQPLPPDLAEALRGFLAGRPAGIPVWPGTWRTRAAAILRRDLAAAGIPYSVDGPEGPLYLDFHALLHGYVALLDEAGASPKEAMHLARHSDPKLTLKRYGKPRLHDMAATVARLPRLLPEHAPDAQPAEAPALRATGTDDSPVVLVAPMVAPTAAGRTPQPDGRCGRGPEMALPSSHRNSLSGEGVAGRRGQVMATEEVAATGFEPVTHGL